MDIVFIGRIAERAALMTAREKKEELAKVYPSSYFMNGISELEAEFAGEDVLMEALRQSVYMNVISEESVADALWRTGEELGKGLRVRRDDIPVAQFAIEMAEVDGRDPIKSDSTGCVICVTDNSGPLCAKLKEKGIACAVIGYLTDDNDRCIMNGEIKSYLTKPGITDDK
ncbi:MAG: hypothetical protein K5655_08495 [Lachnospiraceae bacterium]|nr:hypothetical protein [Lachnospiraceae bacterium]